MLLLFTFGVSMYRFSVCVLPFLAACFPDQPQGPSTDPSVLDVWLLSDIEVGCQSELSDSYWPSTFVDLNANDRLAYQVEYYGGCRSHEFRMCWDGTFTDVGEVDLVLVHDSHNDWCDTWSRAEMEFNLDELRWQAESWADGLWIEVEGEELYYDF
ncbi:MAG: hypothetical protein HN348_15145 [Proteobacteria bacterium]|jgi:hypothetical protein|nr:hypothetical protein [Pseudomonadota bacterium]